MENRRILQGKARFAVLALAAVCLWLFCAPCAAEAYGENNLNYVDGSMDVSGGIPDDAVGVLYRIRQRGVLRVATEPYYPPQEFIDPDRTGQDRYAGADMELARLIAERMGVALEIVEMDFTEVLPSLEEDHCDLAISALAYTPGRSVRYELSKGYYYAEAPTCALLIREADRETIASVEDLASRDLVAQQGSLQETMLIDSVRSYREFRRVPSTQQAVELVARGECDAVAVEESFALDYIAANPDCGLILAEGIAFVPEEQYLGDRVAGRKDELQLMYFVNGVIDEVISGDLYTRWIEEARQRLREIGG